MLNLQPAAEYFLIVITRGLGAGAAGEEAPRSSALDVGKNFPVVLLPMPFFLQHWMRLRVPSLLMDLVSMEQSERDTKKPARVCLPSPNYISDRALTFRPLEGI